MAIMKDTGISWIGEIPVDWNLGKVKYAFDRKKEKSTEKDPVVLSLARAGIRVRDITTNEGQLAASYEGYNPVEPNDLLLNPMDLFSGANCSISYVSGVISPAYMNLRAKEGFDPRFYDYYFKTQYWSLALFAHGRGVSFDNRWTLNESALRDYYIPMPQYEEQQAIGNYLDKKCSRIDEFISEAKASIEEYEDLKKSVLFSAMSKGIIKSVDFRESGLDWLGEIPKTWNLMKITYILDLNDGYPIGDGDHGLIKTESYRTSGIPYIRVQNLGWGTPLNLDNVVYISEEDNERIKSSQLKPNDVLFAKTGGTIGKTAIIPDSMPISNTTSHVGKITVSSAHNPKYVFYMMSSFIGYKQFWDIACMKATRPELSINEIKQMQVLMPATKEEEDRIVEYLDAKLPEYDSLINEKQALIDELETYKKSLIFELVTGKRRVV